MCKVLSFTVVIVSEGGIWADWVLQRTTPCLQSGSRLQPLQLERTPEGMLKSSMSIVVRKTGTARGRRSGVESEDDELGFFGGALVFKNHSSKYFQVCGPVEASEIRSAQDILGG